MISYQNMEDLVILMTGLLGLVLANVFLLLVMASLIAVVVLLLMILNFLRHLIFSPVQTSIISSPVPQDHSLFQAGVGDSISS
ncbi:MAG TPA: hypothetical protein VJ302_06390 [Blastocatellia bacterium]|nr:hypothetical protein [Blastocatellia bacterium]